MIVYHGSYCIIEHPDIQFSREKLDFVAECRKGNNIYKQYDVVMGGVANDKIFATIDAYFAGYMSKEIALEKLKYEQPNQQICFINQLLLNQSLTFIKFDIQ